MVRNVKILGTGKYLPSKQILSSEIDKKCNLKVGATETKFDISHRYYIDKETNSYMGSIAAQRALENAGIGLDEIDCILGVSGSMEQPIPCNAALLQEALGLKDSGIPCFDIQATCLSFITGLDIISFAIDSGKYKKVLLVSSEIASVGLNWEQEESRALFGDGAAAAVIGKSDSNTSKIIASRMETYSEGAHFTEIRGGGAKYHPRYYSETTKNEFTFDMDGKGVFRLASIYMDGFVNKLLKDADISMDKIKVIVPHQASSSGMRLIAKKLNISSEKVINIISNHGNVIAASVPMALHEGIEDGRIERGDIIMLIGTSAGLSFGGVILQY